MVAIEHDTAAELDAPAAQPTPDAIPLRLRRQGGTPRQVLAMTLIGAIVLALFASRDLASWAERLGDGPVAERTQLLTARWDAEMERLGLVRPHEALREWMRGALERGWRDDTR